MQDPAQLRLNLSVVSVRRLISFVAGSLFSALIAESTTSKLPVLSTPIAQRSEQVDGKHS